MYQRNQVDHITRTKVKYAEIDQQNAMIRI